MQLTISRYIDNKAPSIVSQISKISIVDGEVSVDAIQPTIIDPDTGKTLAFIDTSDSGDSLKETDAPLIITKTEVLIKENDIETRSFSTKKIENFYTDRQRTEKWLTVFKNYAVISLFPFAVIGSFTGRILQLLIYAAIGLIVSNRRHANFTYLTLLRLSVMAITPSIIIKTIIGAAGLQIPFLGLINFIIAMFYLNYGLKAASRHGDDQIQEIALNGSPIH